jgi:integrase
MPNITARQAAERWNVSESMARRILSDVPAAGGRDSETGAKLYDQADADAAHEARPGRGVRNDLAAPEPAMTHDQYERLVTDATIPVADRTLWALLWEGNLRLSDVLSLDVCDIDLAERTAQVDYPKRDTDPQNVPFSPSAAALLREAIGERTEGPLLLNENGRPLSRERVIRSARKAGVPSIHAFRHGGYKRRADTDVPD